MKVAYVVTAGEYSDYHIEGIFSTPIAADREAARCKGRVEVYPVNQREMRLGAWCVWMAARDTTADTAAPSGACPPETKFSRYDVTYAAWGDGWYFGTPAKFNYTGHYVIAYGKTKTHAIRSASNAIRQRVAQSA